MDDHAAHGKDEHECQAGYDGVCNNERSLGPEEGAVRSAEVIACWIEHAIGGRARHKCCAAGSECRKLSL
jgi:hypothetical protein